MSAATAHTPSKLFRLVNPMWLGRKILHRAVEVLPGFRFIKDTRGTQTPMTFAHWFNQKVLGHCPDAYWGVHPSSMVSGAHNIYAGIETAPGLMPGCFIQAFNGKIYIGDYTQIGPHVGIISANHLLTDNRKHDSSVIKIGKYCWLGYGSVILPNVELGDYTIVGANAVVTKSFPDGYCVIAGNPAKLVKKIDPAECVHHRSEHEYNGFIRASEFEAFRKEHLDV